MPTENATKSNDPRILNHSSAILDLFLYYVIAIKTYCNSSFDYVNVFSHSKQLRMNSKFFLSSHYIHFWLIERVDEIRICNWIVCHFLLKQFTPSAICCPSRASLLTGTYAHNHRTTNNSASGGCYGEHWKQHVESRTFPVHLQQKGYNTFYAGKYMNRVNIFKNFDSFDLIAVIITRQFVLRRWFKGTLKCSFDAMNSNKSIHRSFDHISRPPNKDLCFYEERLVFMLGMLWE